MIYEKDKTHRITLRLNDSQFDYVLRNANLIGVAPSEFLRMIINMSDNMEKRAAEKINEMGDKLWRENEKTCIDNLV